MHTAVSATPVLRGRKEPVEAILVHAGHLLLAGPYASVAAYTLPERPASQQGDEENTTESAPLLTKPAYVARLSKSAKTVDQLKVIREANLFVSLCDAVVALHDIAAVQETGKAHSGATDGQASVLASAPVVPSEGTTTLLQTKGALTLQLDTSIQKGPQTTGNGQRGGAGYRHQAGHSTIGRAYRPSDVTQGRRTGRASSTMRGSSRPMSLLGMEELQRDKEEKRRFMTMHARSALNREEDAGAEGVMSVVTTLAVACRRKLIVFRWVDGAFWDTKEIHLPHTPRTLAFPTPTTLFMGYTPSEYAILTVPLASASSVADLLDASSSMTAAAQIPSSSLAGTRVDLYEWKLQPLDIPLVGSMADGEGGSAGSVTGQSQPLANAAPSGGMTAMAGAAFTGLTGYIGMANKNRPLVLQIEGGEVLVCRESMGIFLNEDGRPARRDGIEWQSAPDEVAYVKPFVLSILPPTGRQTPAYPLLQVRSASTLVAVQTLPFPPMQEGGTVSAGNYPSVRLLTASPGNKPPLFVKVTPTERGALEKDGLSVWCLEMKSWGRQIDELVEAGEYQEALALLNSVDDVLLEDKEERKAYIESLYAVSLFYKDQYSEAIDHFLELDTNPARVIALYPSYISGPLARDRSEWLEMFGAKGKNADALAVPESSAMTPDDSVDTMEAASVRSGKSTALSQSIPKERSRLHGLWGRRPQSIIGAPESGTPGTSPGKGGLVKPAIAGTEVPEERSDKREAEVKLQGEAQTNTLPPAQIQSKPRPTPSEDERKAIDALGTFLADRRRIFKPILEQQPSSHSITMSQIRRDPAWLLALPSQPLHTLDLEQLTAVAQTVDTALFKTFLASKPGLLGPLCRVENWCEVDQVEELLMERQKYSELIALYGGKEMHDKALELLRRMSEDEDDVELKVSPTVRYLQNLGPEHITLILRASHWVFSEDEDLGMEIFCADTGKVSLLPRFAIVTDLEAFNERLCIRYLEHLIRNLGDGDPSLHEKLAFLLLRRAEVLQDDKERDLRQATLADLLDLLESSQQYRAERVLHRVPTNERDFFDVRALLLGRLGQDEAALRIYVDKLGDHAKAEEYCRRTSVHHPESNAFLTLLRIYLRPKGAASVDDTKGQRSLAATQSPASVGLQLEPALAIISRHGARVDAKAALELLPSLVQLSAVEAFASKALRQTCATHNEASIVSRIAKERAFQVDEQLMALHRRRVKVTETRTCPRCMKRLGNSVIAVTSQGDVLHYGCSKFTN